MEKLLNMIPARPGFYEFFVAKHDQDRRYTGWHVEAWGLLHNVDDNVPHDTENWVRPMEFVKEFEALAPTECTDSGSLGIFYCQALYEITGGYYYVHHEAIAAVPSLLEELEDEVTRLEANGRYFKSYPSTQGSP
jgi:hypothetical protein